MSSHNRSLFLTAEAQDDIEDIRLYTRQEWGSQQEERYTAALLRTIAALGDNPEIDHRRTDLGDAIRSHPSQQYQIFYRLTPTAIIILRILHRRADAYRALTD